MENNKTSYGKLPKIFKQKWIDALRSRKYKQTQSTLVQQIGETKIGKPIMGYCCLGVAGSICGVTSRDMEELGDLSPITTGRIPKLLKDSQLATKLIDMNDEDEYSFAKIATWVEKNL